MENLNMAIRKGYLLAGVIMASNMFVVNEMKASQNQNDLNPQGQSQFSEGEVNNNIIKIPVGRKKEEKFGEQGFVDSLLSKVLTYENTINLIGGSLFTLANSYYKFYENKPGFYFDYYFAGWNSNPFAKGYLQFCPNINLGRGIFWLIPGAYFFIKGLNDNSYMKCLRVSCLVADLFEKSLPTTELLVFFLLQGFVSMPLTVHLSNFSISISLDSIIWGIIGYILDKKYEEILVKRHGKKLLNDIYQINEENNNESEKTIELEEIKIIN